MTRAVDPDREPARDREAALGEVTRERFGVIAAAARRAAAADDRELRAGQQREIRALHPERERRVDELREQRRVILAVERDEVAVASLEPSARAFDRRGVG